MHVSTIQQHLEAFGKYSNHSVTYVPATTDFWNLPPEKVQCIVDFSYFDVVVVHYSVRLSTKDHLDEGLARALEGYNGLKILFIQDEYEETEIARQWMDRLQFDLVYTCVQDSGREQVYPSYRFPSTEFLLTLTGYTPEDSTLEQYAQPIAQRKLLIAYRGRKLNALYGDLGYEKYFIGVAMKRLADELGVSSDIEVDDSKRIYGTAWYQFLGSSRATLGTESGSNVFDFDGSLKTAIAKLEKQNPDISYEEISAKILAHHDGLVQMSQISPKIFEAIFLRTALVLFEGDYSNVVLPNVHFIPLKKDFSNAQEVIRKLQDVEFVQQITDQAYLDIIASVKYYYKKFIASFDADIEVRVLHANQLTRLDPPLLFLASNGKPRQALPAMPASLLNTTSSNSLKLADFDGVSCVGMKGFGLALNRTLAQALILREGEVPITALNFNQVQMFEKSSFLYLTMQKLWHFLPFTLRVKVVRRVRHSVRLNQSISQPKSLIFQVARKAWHLLPLGTRMRLARILESD
jgi:hypothetical protein